MVKKILKFIGLSILVLIVSFLFWFKFIFTEFDEFKNSTFLEHRNHVSTDGPYIIQENDSVRFIEVLRDGNKFEVVSKTALRKEANKKLIVSVYNYDNPLEYSFNFEWRDTLKIPKSEFITKGDIFAVSDIEGNFYAFQKLLKSAQIIDENSNWIFKNNHLVLIGDFVDRGLNVTQCLWLIYKLEKQAKNKGGAVHFINGNHEIFNMAGKVHHVRSKYKLLARKVGLDYSKDLMGESSELGRWLRTKNVIEKINGNLFAHAGVSPKLIALNLSLDSINNKVREYYGRSEGKIAKDKLALILYSEDGPFWYRGNTRNISENIQNEMNKVINHFKVKRLIIGHSTKSDIRAYHNNTLYNIDVHFPNTDAEINRGMGLLIQGDAVFKIDDKGVKTKLE